MAWEDPPTWDADDPWLHTDANQYVTDNTQYLKDQLSNTYALLDWDEEMELVVSGDLDWHDVWSFAIPAGELDGENGYRMVIAVWYDNDATSAVDVDFRLRFSTTTLAEVSGQSVGAHSAIYGFVDTWLWEDGANTQRALLHVHLTNEADSDNSQGADQGTGAVDSSSARNLVVQGRHSSASGSIKTYRLSVAVFKFTKGD
jgi:hypothetical protein